MSNEMNETILNWFRRENPDELWAVHDFPKRLTFADVYESMKKGDAMGKANECGDTKTRELVLRRIAKLRRWGIDCLIEWSDRNVEKAERRARNAK